MKPILVKYLQTEKTTGLEAERDTYSFVVNIDANKLTVKKEVETQYNVTVEKVRTMVYRSNYTTKFTKQGRIEGKTARYKKALITLKEGDTIDFYENQD